jgi:hypothetical protein
MKPQKAAHYKQPFAFYSVLKKIVIKKNRNKIIRVHLRTIALRILEIIPLMGMSFK